jgi:type II secretory pathway component PulJ
MGVVNFAAAPAARRSVRPGHSLAELVVALTIAGALGLILAAILSGAQSFTRSYRERVRAVEATRVASTIMGAELRYLEPEQDLRSLEDRSMELRNFRGVAVVCAAAGEAVSVRYRGLRAPDPVKDSVVGMGTVRPSELLASAPVTSGCPRLSNESLYLWTLAEPPGPGELLLLFESGSYHLAGGALRYRRGESGRQPLTAELFDDAEIAFRPVDPAGIELVLATTAPAGTPPPHHQVLLRSLLGLPNGWRR